MAKPALKKIAPKPAQRAAAAPVVATPAKNPKERIPDAAFDMKGKLSFPVSDRVQVVLDDSTYTPPAGKKPVRSIGLTKVVLNANGHYYAVARVAVPARFFLYKKTRRGQI